jgi:hypothetical protein
MDSHFKQGKLFLGEAYSDGSGYNTAQVVDYNVARIMFAHWGCALHRENDSTLLVSLHPTEEEKNRAFFKIGEGSDVVQVCVDQGFFTNTDHGDRQGFSYHGQEVVDYLSVLRVFHAKFCATADVNHGEACIGRGRAHRNSVSGYIEAIMNADFPEKEDLIDG